MTPYQTTLRKGIAGYAHEQAVLLRLLRRFGEFTERDFDRWLRGREWKKPRRFSARGIAGDHLILGIGKDGISMWSTWLELLQIMARLGMVETCERDGLVVYKNCDTKAETP